MNSVELYELIMNDRPLNDVTNKTQRFVGNLFNSRDKRIMFETLRAMGHIPKRGKLVLMTDVAKYIYFLVTRGGCTISHKTLRYIINADLEMDYTHECIDYIAETLRDPDSSNIDYISLGNGGGGIIHFKEPLDDGSRYASRLKSNGEPADSYLKRRILISNGFLKRFGDEIRAFK